MIVRDSKTSPVVRQRETDDVEEPEQAFREQEAEEEPDDRSECPDDERLDDHGSEYLPIRGADRPQGRELARALRDRDRERVCDDERADEERDAPEREQELLQEGDEAHWCPRRPRRPAAAPS